MSDERQPSYDFFPPPKSQPSGPSQPSGHSGQPSYSGQSSHSGRSVAVTPPATRGPAFGAPQTYQPQRPWADQIPPVPGRGILGMPTWLFVLIVLVGGFFIVGILAAIAIPVFLSQHSKAQWQNTTVALPDTFAGVDRGTDKKSLALAKTFADEQVKPEDVGIYGAGTSSVMVIVAVKLPTAMSSVQQAVERREYQTAFAASGMKLSLHAEEEPGPLGGWLGCGSTTQGVRVCLATDSASLVTMISAPAAGDAVALMRQARAQTVTRR